jgi:phosphatidate cytidylyltransferase
MFKTLLIRSLSGLVFTAVMVAGILFHPVSYALLMMSVIGILTVEYFQIVLGRRQIFAQCVVVLTGWLLFLLFYALMRVQMRETWFLVLVFPVTLLWVSLLYNKRAKNYAKAPNLFIPIIYIALPFALTNLLVFNDSGIFISITLLALFVILWSSDVGAYIFGMSFGQKNGHKLFPSLSPKKSWEGFFGGLLMALLAGYILHRMDWLHLSLLHCLIVSTLLHIFGVWGDLAESQLKRHFHVKDSGKMMPGHGGLLDRFDSALLAFPIVIAYIKLIEILT